MPARFKTHKAVKSIERTLTDGARAIIFLAYDKNFFVDDYAEPAFAVAVLSTLASGTVEK